MPKIVKFSFLALLLLLFTGCNIELLYKKPTVSNIEVSGKLDPIKIKVVDKRKADTKWHVNIGPLARKVADSSFIWYDEDSDNLVNEIEKFASELAMEFKAKKIPVEVVKDGEADMVIEIKNYQLISHRFTGFDPFVAHHVFYADFIANDNSSHPIPFYFFNGKVPIWSFEKEVADPCFNMPFSILVKEVAAKINSKVFKTSSSSDKVASIVSKVNENIDDDEVFWDIIALGLTNNKEAIPTLKKLVENDDRFIRGCALSALGTLGAVEEFAFLKSCYNKFEEVDKYLAFKSIGDLAYLGSEDAKAFVEEIKKLPKDDKSLAVLNYLDNVYKL